MTLEEKLEQVLNTFGNEVKQQASWMNLGGEFEPESDPVEAIKQIFADEGYTKKHQILEGIPAERMHFIFDKAGPTVEIDMTAEGITYKSVGKPVSGVDADGKPYTARRYDAFVKDEVEGIRE